jgi:hypothetical protein
MWTLQTISQISIEILFAKIFKKKLKSRKILNRKGRHLYQKHKCKY